MGMNTYKNELGDMTKMTTMLIQSNFNGSNTFGTKKISSRQGEFEPMRVDYSVRSGGLILISFLFSLTQRYVVCSY